MYLLRAKLMEKIHNKKACVMITWLQCHVPVSTEHKISTAHKKRKIKNFIAFKLLDVFIMLINVKMPIIVGILTFMSIIIFVLS